MFRIGIIGAGRGFSQANAFVGMPDCEIAAICDLDESRLEEFTRRFPGATGYTDYTDMLGTGLDIIVVASPMPWHARHSIAALEAGAHVLQEVSLASNLEECESLVRAARAHPRQKFMLAENCCYWAHILSWQAIAAQGLLGQFMYAEAEYVHDVRTLLRDAQGRPTWRASLPPIHYCTHSLGPLLKVTGERCISASGLSCGSKLNPDLGNSDAEVGIFQTASGGVIKVLCAFGIRREPAFHYYSLYGTKGTLETARPPSPLATSAYLEAMPFTHGMSQIPLDYNVPGLEATGGGHGTAEWLMVQDFMRCVRGDSTPPIDIYTALDMAVPGLCAHESALRGGNRVPVPDWR
jgi:predicted dehydrogenase